MVGICLSCYHKNTAVNVLCRLFYRFLHIVNHASLNVTMKKRVFFPVWSQFIISWLGTSSIVTMVFNYSSNISSTYQNALPSVYFFQWCLIPLSNFILVKNDHAHNRFSTTWPWVIGQKRMVVCEKSALCSSNNRLWAYGTVCFLNPPDKCLHLLIQFTSKTSFSLIPMAANNPLPLHYPVAFIQLLGVGLLYWFNDHLTNRLS